MTWSPLRVRNRIVVKKKYAANHHLAGWLACLFGIAIWLRSQDRFQRSTFRILARALTDGWHARMGNYPAALSRLECKKSLK